ncbi:hypothetical protein JMJ35_008202 [Cladonia borealis]|uniref:Uncharacterized protein n=1 Tax=Cladonia borealis TaxID=184061 RepID=A0AA39QV92_9LECA|nr:hypothetical protein JMJ35_008202 [Cladonia borealis]
MSPRPASPMSDEYDPEGHFDTISAFENVDSTGVPEGFYTAPELRPAPPGSSQEYDPSGCFRTTTAFGTLSPVIAPSSPPDRPPPPSSPSSTDFPSSDIPFPPVPTMTSTYLAALIQEAPSAPPSHPLPSSSLPSRVPTPGSS